MGDEMAETDTTVGGLFRQGLRLAILYTIITLAQLPLQLRGKDNANKLNDMQKTQLEIKALLEQQAIRKH
jgi:hypothetical protein